ncbi:MAG: hypothetical protein J7K22_01200 [Nanoarchaeota archaeon]|nr:hypothetical protein [Nanoarchaeota archaeon]
MELETICEILDNPTKENVKAYLEKIKQTRKREYYFGIARAHFFHAYVIYYMLGGEEELNYEEAISLIDKIEDEQFSIVNLAMKNIDEYMQLCRKFVDRLTRKRNKKLSLNEMNELDKFMRLSAVMERAETIVRLHFDKHPFLDVAGKKEEENKDIMNSIKIAVSYQAQRKQLRYR